MRNRRGFITKGTLMCCMTLLGLASPHEAAANPKKLVLEIHQVQCNNETTETDIGSDEIAMAGLTIDPTGSTRKAPTWKLGKFDKNKKVKFSSPKQFASFDLRNATKFPAVYQVTLVLAERDKGGGLGTYVDKLIEEAKGGAAAGGKPSLASKAAAVAAKCVAAGAVTPEACAAVAAPEISKEFLDRAEKLIADVWKDDIFPPRLATFPITKPDLHIAGSQKKTAVFKGHKGKYTVTYSWRLIS